MKDYVCVLGSAIAYSMVVAWVADTYIDTVWTVKGVKYITTKISFTQNIIHWIT